ncbi:DUF1127 domain-containing protein [Azospirillum sp.]|uniref:DUF1127 domain-containing protein n=1 Tax=Azospirillum sp. TaxID=34012 RepID=UPI002D38D31D|nr:DUF1127 domain-containing protein [Azospirillum sp.]HYD65677.1 DUF1127 domain-containing protein [Azospirillum sp.]
MTWDRKAGGIPAAWWPGALDGVRRQAARLGAPLTAMVERARQRQALAKLDDALLRDIGLTRAEARREAEKPIWKR